MGQGWKLSSFIYKWYPFGCSSNKSSAKKHISKSHWPLVLPIHIGSLGNYSVETKIESVIMKPLWTSLVNKAGLGTRESGWDFLSTCWVPREEAEWHPLSSFWLTGWELGLWPQYLKRLYTPGNQRSHPVLAVCCLCDTEHREINHCQRGKLPTCPSTPAATWLWRMDEKEWTQRVGQDGLLVIKVTLSHLERGMRVNET